MVALKVSSSLSHRGCRGCPPGRGRPRARRRAPRSAPARRRPRPDSDGETFSATIRSPCSATKGSRIYRGQAHVVAGTLAGVCGAAAQARNGRSRLASARRTHTKPPSKSRFAMRNAEGRLSRPEAAHGPGSRDAEVRVALHGLVRARAVHAQPFLSIVGAGVGRLALRAVRCPGRRPTIKGA
jgi:hypothetical protein